MENEFNPEKLLWLNHHYIKEAKPDDMAKLATPFLAAKGYAVGTIHELSLPNIVKTVQERSKTLMEMARKRPQSRDALLSISGVGDHKLKQYGEQFLAVIAVHAVG